MRSYLFGVFFIAVASFSTALAGDEPPSWLRQDAAITTPKYEKDIQGVVLRDEQSVNYDSNGKVLVTNTFSVRILLREGRGLASAEQLYLTSSGKIREINAWLIRADGQTKRYDKDYVVDRVSDIDDVYNEYRVKEIDASRDADEGSVFGYQIVSEERPLFNQDIWEFQHRLPTIFSKYSLSLPSGWKATSITFNHPEIQPQVNGNTYSWEMRNLGPIPREPSSPSIRNMAPRIAVNYFAEKGTAPTYKDWTEVSRWMTSMHEGQVIVDDAVAIKARELTANAPTEFDKIKAIGHYVQNLQYISIDIGVGYGNGYRPRSSSLVLSRGYGDCKDKANLMRAMLRVLKIEAYPIAIFSGDPTFTREEWASPYQFNHCIIAVRVGDATKAPTIIEHPKLGRLMIFDATDPYTPVGDLPDYLQGSMALIAAGDNGGIFKMPVTPPEANMLDRKAEIILTQEGSVSGIIREQTIGQTSTGFRREFRELKPADYNKMIEAWLTDSATGAKATKITPTDLNAEGKFNLDIEFSAPRYAQLMQNRLLVFKPVIVSRRDTLRFTEQTRKNPILFDSVAFNEAVSFILPPGFIIDETPEALKLETPFGKYSTSYEATKDGKLLFKRSYRLNQTVIAAADYKSVKDFYAKILEAEQSPVVLMRK